MERPGSAVILVSGLTPACAQARLRRFGPGGLCRRRLAVDVGDAEPTSDDELGQTEGREERAEHLGRLLEGGRLEDLAADVRVHADQLDRGHELQGGHRLRGGTGGDGEAELRVLLPRPHELMGVRLHAGRHPDQDLGPLPSKCACVQNGAQAGDFVEGVDDDAADPVFERGRQFVGRLVVAVQNQPLGGDTGGQRDVLLAARRHVEVHALFVGQPGHGAAQEGLGGIGDPVTPSGDRLTTGLA